MYQSYLSYEYEYNQAQNQAKNLSKTLEEQVKSIFDRMDLVILDIKNTIHERSEIKKWSIQEINQILTSRFDYIPEAYALRLVDEEGYYHGSTMMDVQVANVSDWHFFRAHKENPQLGLYISEPLRSWSTGEWIITVSRRMNKASGQFDGLVLGTIRLHYFNQFFNGIQVGQSGNITLHTLNDFNMLARYPLLEDKIGQTIKIPEAFHQMLAQGKDEGVWESFSPIDNINKVFSYHAVRRLNLAVVVGLANDDFLSGWRRNTFLWIVFLGLSFGLHGFFLYRHLKSADMLEEQRTSIITSSKLSSLGEMAGGVAHEINNPLAVIQGRSEQIGRILSRQPVDLDRAIVLNQNIQDTISRIAKIVKGLRTFARNAENDPMGSSQIREVIESTMDLCRERFRANGVHVQIGPIPDVVIECRETQIAQVLVNLLNNSYDAIRDLKVKWIRVEFSVSQSMIEMKVTDSGPGISKDIQEKIMQPFFTTKPVGQGTGLGLSISSSIIDEHGGKLFLNTESPNTQFVILLPVKAGQQVVRSA